MSRFALRLRGVNKRYGKTKALDGLTLDVPKGAIVGLIGPNGAGKTTTFGVASGNVRPDDGAIDVLGEGPFEPGRHGGRLTVLPQDCQLAPHSSARQLLRFYAELAGQTRAAAHRDADRVLDLVQLEGKADARVGQLSHGMKRRLAVAQALLGEPELVLLDEPTGGLDPHLVVQMREVLRQQRGKRTLVVSSHILADLEAICDRVAFLDKGRCVQEGPVEELTQQAGTLRIRLEEALDVDRIAGRAVSWEGATLRIELAEDEEPSTVNAEVLPALVEAGGRIVEVRVGESLEDAYMASRRR
ncbi:MAG: ABC transporter ATP-binding protein [Sandaracinaceae bacterium]